MNNYQPLRSLSLNLTAALAFLLSLLGIKPPDTTPSADTQVQSFAAEKPDNETAAASKTGERDKDNSTQLPTLPQVRATTGDRWDDPFLQRDPVLKPHDLCKPDDGQHFAELRRFIRTLLRKSCQRLQILPIQLESGELRTQKMNRVSTRHAVEFALTTSGFEPIFENRMSYVSPVWSIDFSGQKKLYTAEVPLRLYARDGQKDATAKDLIDCSGSHRTPDTGNTAQNHHREFVLVCWIDHELLGRQPIRTLTGMLENLLGWSLMACSNIHYIGPNYSSELERINQELSEWNTDDCKNIPPSFFSNQQNPDKRRFWLICPAATSPPDDISRLQLWMNYSNLMAEDSTLACSLVKELKSRRSDHGNVLIVTQANGVSPQGLSKEIQQRLNSAETGNDQFPEKADGKFPAGSVILTYLKNAAADGPAENGSQSSRLSDYFQHQLTNINQSSEKIRGEDVSAVIVLGDDPYDKLEVIRALKPLFVNATYYTHDLHLCFYEPAALPFTRGLVVGSRGTLAVTTDNHTEKAIGMTTPGIVFRDGYQKSVYYAVLRALSPERSRSSDVDRIVLTEIGYGGPVLLQDKPITLADNSLFWFLFRLGLVVAVILILAAVVYFLITPQPLRNSRYLSTVLSLACKAGGHCFIRWTKLESTVKMPPPPKSGFSIFHSIFEIRSEIAIAGLSTLLVWRKHLPWEPYATALTLCIWLFYGLTAHVILSSIPPISLWISAFEQRCMSFFGCSTQIATDRGNEWRHFRLWFFVFALATFPLAAIDFVVGIPLVMEPAALTSGISAWPVLAGLIGVCLCLNIWLWSTWRTPMQYEQCRIAVPSVTWLPLGNVAKTSRVYFLQLTKSNTELKEQISRAEPSVDDQMQAGVRIATWVLLLLFACIQWHPNWNQLINWGLLPLPPARAALLQASLVFFVTLGLLLAINASITGLIQVGLLRNLIAKMTNKLNSDLEERSAPGGRTKHRSRAVHFVEACQFIQQSTSFAINHSLKTPALLFVLYALCRLPIFESWAASSNTILLVAGLPAACAVALAFMLRSSSSLFRSRCLTALDQMVQPHPFAARQQPADEKLTQTVSTCREMIQAFNAGAFSNIWTDPILGTVFFLATALGSSQSFNPFSYLKDVLSP